MNPNIWGPPLWNTLHMITFNFPEQPTDLERSQYRDFFFSLRYVLPCENCRQHYAKAVEKTYPIDSALQNRDTLTRWLVDLHNVVNKRLGKPIVSYESVKQKFEEMQGKCAEKCAPTSCADNGPVRKRTDHLLYIAILLMIVIISLFVYYLPRIKSVKSY